MRLTCSYIQIILALLVLFQLFNTTRSMKKNLLLSLLPILISKGFLFSQTSGGPDNYGYTWKNQADSNGVYPTYNWKEIKGKGTILSSLKDDDHSGALNIGWNFQYYWHSYHQFWVGSNGWISFQEPKQNIAAPFLLFPNPELKNTICPLLSDLTFTTESPVTTVPGASAWYWSNNVDTLIVQYDSVPFFVQGNTAHYSGRNTFQVILSGVDQSITFQYKLHQPAIPEYPIVQQGLLVGIESANASSSLRVVQNDYPAAKSAIKFYYPASLNYLVEDVTPLWNQQLTNGGIFVSNPCGKNRYLKTNVASVGTQAVSKVPVKGQLINQTKTTVWKDSTTIHSLSANADSSFSFQTNFSPMLEGTYSYQTEVSLFSDGYNKNDINNTELVVVDTSQASIRLSYSPANTTLTGLTWQGGRAGAGVYFIPPFYPATITSIDYYIVANGGVNSGFTAQLFKDNGTSGLPGTLVESIPVSKSTITSLPGYHTVTLANPYTITSGGVYAAWMMNGDSIQLGTDGTLPLSNRNVEYIADTWNPYRNNYAEDLMIRLNIKGSNTATLISSSSQPATCATCPDGTANVSTSGGTPPYTYLWQPTQQTTSTITGMPGTYTVCITDSKGCPTCKLVTIPYSTSVHEAVENIFVTISPNPFSGSTHVVVNQSNPHYKNLFFAMYDMYGREIKAVDLSSRASHATIQFNLPVGDTVASGLYYYKMYDAKQIFSTGKLVVE
jgi:hypothetical protein